MFIFRYFSYWPHAAFALVALFLECGESGCSAAATTPSSTAVLPTLSSTTYPPNSSSTHIQPSGIVAGPDGNLWFASCFIGSTTAMMRITTSGQMSSFALPAGVARCPQWVTVGSDGAMWFTEVGINVGGPLPQLGRIDVSGNITEFTLPAGDAPVGIASGKDGNLWYDAYTTNSNSIIVRGFSPTTHSVIGSVSITVQNQLLDFFNNVVVNPSDGNVIVSGGLQVFRVVPGTSPTLAANIPVRSDCELASIGSDSNIYFQCAEGQFAKANQTTYDVQTSSEDPSFQNEHGTNQTFFVGPIFQGASGLLYSWGGYEFNRQATLSALLGLTTGGTLTGYYTAGPHDVLVQGVAGPDGATWFTVENLHGSGYILRIGP